MNAEESARAQTLTVRPALVEAAVWTRTVLLSRRGRRLKPVDDVHASFLLSSTKGRSNNRWLNSDGSTP